MRPLATTAPLVLSLMLEVAPLAAASATIGGEAEAGPALAGPDGDAAAPAPSATPGGRSPSGFQHALRLGVSLPAGESSDGRALGSDVDVRVPITLDVGYRASRLVYVGLVGVAGVDAGSDDCGLAAGASGAACTLEGWRLGAEVLLHPMDADRLDLWLGLAVGWEQFQQKALVPSGEDGASGLTLKSVEQGPALELQAGMDFPVEGRLAVGPYAAYAAGVYLDRSTECAAGASCPGDIDELGVHHWLTLGVRGRFGP